MKVVTDMLLFYFLILINRATTMTFRVVAFINDDFVSSLIVYISTTTYVIADVSFNFDLFH